MTVTLMPSDVEAAKAWLTVIARVRPADRRILAIFAVENLGNVQIVTCEQHGRPLMSITEAYKHALRQSRWCDLSVDVTRYEVRP